MSKLIFIPLSDELIYDHPEWISGPVIPFVQDARRVSSGASPNGRLTEIGHKDDNHKPSDGRSKTDPGFCIGR